MCGLARDATALEIGGAGFAEVARVLVQARAHDGGGSAFIEQARDDFGVCAEVCLVGDGRVFQKLVAGDGGLGLFAVTDCEARDGEGRFFAGEEALERFVAAHAVHGHVGVVVKRCDADVLYAHGCRNSVDRIACDFELVARIGTGLVHAFLGGVAAFGRVVTNHVGHVVLGGGIFPGDAVKACRVQKFVLVLFGVVADFASAGSGFPAVRAQVAPVPLVVAVALRNVVFRVHEGIVEEPEIQREQGLVARDRRVVVVCRIDGDAPRGLFEQTIKMRQEFGLVILGSEVDSEIELGAVDMIFAPVPETRLHECDTRVVVVFRGKVGVELLVEPQEFLVAPVGIIRGAVAARVFGIRLGVGLVRLDVVGDCGGALHLLGAARCVRDGCARVLDAEPHDGLVPAARDIVEHLFETAPVVVDLVVGLALHHGAGEAVREFERNRFLKILLALGLVGPEYDSLHGLESLDFLVEGDGTVRRE